MKRINLKKMVLVLSIIIILNLFFNYGIKTFYYSPKYDDFCNPEIISKTYLTQEDCLSVGGFWSENPNYNYEDVNINKNTPVLPEIKEKAGYCNPYFTCEKKYREARDVYDRNVFIILIVLGTVSIVAGFLISISEAVSLGFSFGGLISLFIGTVRYWSAMDDYLRFFILGVVLITLIFIGIKKFRE